MQGWPAIFLMTQPQKDHPFVCISCEEDVQIPSADMLTFVSRLGHPFVENLQHWDTATRALIAIIVTYTSVLITLILAPVVIRSVLFLMWTELVRSENTLLTRQQALILWATRMISQAMRKTMRR